MDSLTDGWWDSKQRGRTMSLVQPTESDNCCHHRSSPSSDEREIKQIVDETPSHHRRTTWFFFLHRAKLMTLRYKANVTWILLHIFASCLLADGGLHIITNRCSVGECSSCCREKDHVRPVCALHIIFKPKHIIACLESRACEEKRTLPTEPSTLTNGNNNISRSLIFWNDSVPMMNLVAKSLFFKVSYCICFIWRGFGSLGELFCRFLTFLLMCLDFLLFVFCLGTNKAALAPAGSSGEDVCPLWEECLCRKRGFQKETA